MEELQGPKIILVIDDDELIRAAVAAILQRKGYIVASAKNQAEARDLIERRSHPFTMILLDVTLENQGDGLEFLAVLRNELKQACPIMMISGAWDVDRARTAADHSICGYVVKPFTAGFLEERVLAAIKGARSA